MGFADYANFLQENLSESNIVVLLIYTEVFAIDRDIFLKNQRTNKHL